MSGRLTRAIAHASRQESPIDFAKDDQVLFWNVSVDAKQRGWRGPARVVTIDLSAKTVEMAYGGQYITRHISKVKRVAEMRAEEKWKKCEIGDVEESLFVVRCDTQESPGSNLVKVNLRSRGTDSKQFILQFRLNKIWS